MVYEFNSTNAYETVGNLMQASKSCKGLIHPKDIKYRIIFKLYDSNGSIVSEYRGSAPGWAKLIKKDMHRIERGSIVSTLLLNYKTGPLKILL